MKKKRIHWRESREEKIIDSIDKVLNKYYSLTENMYGVKWEQEAKKALGIIRRIVKPRKAERV